MICLCSREIRFLVLVNVIFCFTFSLDTFFRMSTAKGNVPDSRLIALLLENPADHDAVTPEAVQDAAAAVEPVSSYKVLILR